MTARILILCMIFALAGVVQADRANAAQTDSTDSPERAFLEKKIRSTMSKWIKCKQIRATSDRSIRCDFCAGQGAADLCAEKAKKLLAERNKDCVFVYEKLAGPAAGCDPIKDPYLGKKDCLPGILVSCHTADEVRKVGVNVRGVSGPVPAPADVSGSKSSGTLK